MSLYDSLMERMNGRQYSNYFSAYCPFDSHKTPALLVHDDGLFLCLSCGKKGTLSFLDKKIGSHFHPRQVDTASRVFPSWKGWEQDWGDLEGIANAAHRQLLRSPNHQTYFRRRKIYEFVNDGNLGYLDGWCLFPVYSSTKKLVDIVVRSVSKESDVRYVVRPDSSNHLRPLYVPSWEKVNQSRDVYVVYGIIDSISLHLAGLPVVTGITGKSLHPDLLSPLNKRFIIIPDKGEEDSAYKLSNKIGWKAKVREIVWPDDTKDTDDIRRKFGNEFLLQTLGV